MASNTEHGTSPSLTSNSTFVESDDGRKAHKRPCSQQVEFHTPKKQRTENIAQTPDVITSNLDLIDSSISNCSYIQEIGLHSKADYKSPISEDEPFNKSCVSSPDTQILWRMFNENKKALKLPSNADASDALFEYMKKYGEDEDDDGSTDSCTDTDAEEQASCAVTIQPNYYDVNSSHCGVGNQKAAVVVVDAQTALPHAALPHAALPHGRSYTTRTTHYQQPHIVSGLNSSGSEEHSGTASAAELYASHSSSSLSSGDYIPPPADALLPLSAGQLNASVYNCHPWREPDEEEYEEEDDGCVGGTGRLYTDQGRHVHNAKERARRARIKNACETLRDMVPGIGNKTDKASVLEYGVQYIRFMRHMIGSTFDKEFVKYMNTPQPSS